MDSSYIKYKHLDKSLKKKMIEDCKQSDQYTKPNPQGDSEFQEYDFIKYEVQHNKNKIRLATYRFNAKEQCIGVIFMFHGLNSHIGHGSHLAEFFSHHGFTTVGFDYRGFGRSEGLPGYIDNFITHLDDCKHFIKAVSGLYKSLPKFALGLSLGGATIYSLALQNPQLFSGVILMAPALKSNNPVLLNIGKVVQIFLPKETQLFKPIFGIATKNKLVTQHIKKDKFSYSGKVYSSTLLEVIGQNMRNFGKTVSDFSAPFMVIQGALDKLVNPDGAIQLFELSKTRKEDKQILFYQNMWHDIWHQQQIHDILPKIVEWINKRIEKIKANEDNEKKRS